MRLLHTSDLHIGQSFFDRSRHHEHRAFLNWLVDLARTREVDAVLIAGDVFDTGTPSSQARELYNGFCADMSAIGTQLLIVGGNHDSPAVLGETRRLLASLSTVVIPEVSSTIDDQVHVILRRDGRPGMVLCGVPFVRSRDVTRSMPGQSADEKRAAIMVGIAKLYADIHALGLARRAELGVPGLPIVATGHLATVGANTSDSVRELYIGNLNTFPTDQLPPADYVALGHIHRPQVVGGHDHIRYCGSPLTLSFDELGQSKQVLLVEFEEGQRCIESIPVPVFQPLQRVFGTFPELQANFNRIAAEHVHDHSVWCEVTVFEADHVPELVKQLDDMIQGLPIEILRARRPQTAARATAIEAQVPTLDDLMPKDVFEQLLAARSVDQDLHPRLQEMFDELVVEILTGAAS